MIRFHETCALCTALKSFAALEDFTESFVKHDTNVVNVAMLHALQPVPSTFLPPKYSINITPAIDITLYTDVSDVFQILAFTADFS